MKIIILFLLLITSNVIISQTPNNYDCKKLYSLYKEFEKIDMFADAIVPYRDIFNQCPNFSKGIYIDGIKIYKGIIDTQTDSVVVNKYVDTLCMIYKQRIAFYGEEGIVTGRMALDIYKYKKDTNKNTEVFSLLEKSIGLLKNETDLSVVITHIQLAEKLYEAAILDREAYINLFITDYRIINSKMTGETDPKKIKTLEQIQSLLNNQAIKHNITNNELDNWFNELYNGNPDDVENLKTISQLMVQLNASDNKLYIIIVEKIYKSAPNAESAYRLAQYFRKNEVIDKSIYYYNEAINYQNDNIKLAEYHYEMAVVYSMSKNYQKARDIAKKSIDLNPNYGSPCILIAVIYAQQAQQCGTDAFSSASVYWLAADYLLKAKLKEPSLEKDVNDLLVKYTTQFPSKEEAFMHNITENNEVLIPCWINEYTKARFNR